MTRYNVHIYREMKLRFDGIEAGSPEAAANIARDGLTEDADDMEPCDGETFSALVDVVGDDEFTQSVTIDFESERLRKAASELLEALQTLAEQTDEDCPAEYRTRHFTDALEHARAVIAAVVTERRPA